MVLCSVCVSLLAARWRHFCLCPAPLC
uniref:Uncharacterized protein n=1 Tax=Anguilla anguilla TaxID=7936 RepID=A0A0E9T2H3_ANGAN